jgi:hypothetical protein
MKIINHILISAGLVLMLACGGGPKIAIVKQNDLDLVKQSKVASNFYMVSKKVNYLETLFRGLWLETKTSSMDVSGIWNPDEQFSNIVASKLDSLSLSNQNLSELIAENTMIENYNTVLSADYLKNSSGEHPEIPGTFMPPLAAFFDKYPSYPEFEVIRQALVAKGIDYYFEYLSTDMYGNAVGYGMVTVSMPSQMRLIDLKNKSVIWKDVAWASEVYQLGGDLSKLETNNLEKLKEGLIVGLDKIFALDRIGPAFGIVPPKSK